MQREEAAGLQGCRQPQSKVLQLTGHLRLLLLTAAVETAFHALARSQYGMRIKM